MKITRATKFVIQAVFPVLLIGLIGWFDYLTGREIAVFPLYIIPVVQLTWEFGWRGALIGVVLTVATWIYASVEVGQVYSSEMLRVYNGLVRGVVFALAGFFIILFKRTLNTHRMRMEAMRSLLNVCHGCGAVQGSDGQWVDVEDLMKSQPKPVQCECPRCAAAACEARTVGGQAVDGRR